MTSKLLGHSKLLGYNCLKTEFLGILLAQGQCEKIMVTLCYETRVSGNFCHWVLVSETQISLTWLLGFPRRLASSATCPPMKGERANRVYTFLSWTQPGRWPHHIYSQPIGQNVILCPHLTAKEAQTVTLYPRWPRALKNMGILLLCTKVKEWKQVDHLQSLPQTIGIGSNGAVPLRS